MSSMSFFMATSSSMDFLYAVLSIDSFVDSSCSMTIFTEFRKTDTQPRFIFHTVPSSMTFEHIREQLETEEQQPGQTNYSVHPERQQAGDCHPYPGQRGPRRHRLSVWLECPYRHYSNGENRSPPSCCYRICFVGFH